MNENAPSPTDESTSDAAAIEPPASPDGDREGEASGPGPEIVDEVLIEEVGIDGMCGVY